MNDKIKVKADILLSLNEVQALLQSYSNEYQVLDYTFTPRLREGRYLVYDCIIRYMDRE